MLEDLRKNDFMADPLRTQTGFQSGLSESLNETIPSL
jgi:hypothetical protein